MKSALCRKLGIEFPLFAFSHCRDVVAAVSNAGGFGVLGAVAHTAESLEIDLRWIDEHVNGKPYGIDLLIPKGGAARLLDVAFSHPIKLFVNALGVPPPSIMARARDKGILVGALTGAKEHAIKHAKAGVDILVVAGTEAGGHCGEVSTMVLVPEVLQAVAAYKDIDVLAAGGIATGRQMAACMAMGAAGAWTASVWLTTAEAETTPTVKKKMLAATSRDTVRSRSRTGKPTRQLKSAWTDGWHGEHAPDPLPMPLQGLISRPALAKIDKLAASGHEGAQLLATYYVGQAVGLMNTEQSARSVVYDFMKDYAEAAERLASTLED